MLFLVTGRCLPKPNTNDVFFTDIIREELDINSKASITETVDVLIIDGPQGLQLILLDFSALKGRKRNERGRSAQCVLYTSTHTHVHKSLASISRYMVLSIHIKHKPNNNRAHLRIK